MASVSKFTCFHSALIRNNEVTITEDKLNAVIKAASVNKPGLSTKVLANVNIGSFIHSVRAGGSAPTAGPVPTGGPAPAATIAPAEEKKVEAKKEESEEFDVDMGFNL
uniref:60S acidic ribosomal protein P1-like n=1 Tax=Jaculus jaculus TaxID=51337 RepID=UPI001E1B01E8|nr:60S acidic ribosomal protein P1-like [Jaculus jaculus]